MKQYNAELTIGMDLGNKTCEICILNTSDGSLIVRETVCSDIVSIKKYFSKFTNPMIVQIALEAGTHSPWIYHLLKEMKFHVLVGHPRKLRAIWDNDNKNDQKDAEMLARIARFDTKLLSPIKHRSQSSHIDLSIIKCRDGLVSSRTNLVNMVRGLLKSQGINPPSCSTVCFPKNIYKILPEEVYSIFSEVLSAIDDITVKIHNLDKKIEKKCKEYNETESLRQIKGIGPVTSLSYILTLENHNRFRKSRDVGAFLGLTPKRDQSGDIDKQLGITKAGNRYLRKLLIGSAQYILGPFGEDCDLRRYGLKIAERGGKIAKRKAVVAVARKLAVLMHSLWRSGEDYNPLRKNKKITDVKLAEVA